METDLPIISAWPPTYTLKKSARVRHVRLKASVKHGLELVVPLRFNAKNIPEILETNKLWIEKHLARIQDIISQDKLNEVQQQALPVQIHLKALDQTWFIYYIPSDTKKLKIHLRPQNELVLLGDINNKDLCKKLLSNWVRKQAHRYLLTRLKQLSEQTQLPYSDASIRGQRSRWGSCSADKSINLNYKLLFLPTHLVDHIIIHELCHTVQLNHSTKFWRYVASYDSAWKENSREVRLAEKFVPAWIE